jgi:DNA mismatch repair protein MutL
MSRIHILPKDLANKIAAGEVVENPASAIKELIENSIDAQANQIQVFYNDSGSHFEFGVSDTGHGMERDDLSLSLKRHATSKITTVDDLFRISSLGFRGEALASLGAVSNLSIISQTKESDVAHRLSVDENEAITLEETEKVRPSGTHIVISDLFYNTPARKKYLRTKNTEYTAILDIVTKYAVSFPHISFMFKRNGSLVFETKGNGNLLETIAVLYGVDIAKQLIPFEVEDNHFKITGFIGKPSITRATKQMLLFYINNRYIKSTSLTNAVLEGYSNLIMDHRYPVCFLNIEVDTSEVDVNIHPAKRFVKIEHEKELCSTLTDAVDATLTEHQTIPNASFDQAKRRNESQYTLIRESSEPNESAETTSQTESTISKTDKSDVFVDAERQRSFSDALQSADDAVISFREDFNLTKPTRSEKTTAHESEEETSGNEDSSKKQEHGIQNTFLKADDRSIRIIGQFNKLYILCQLEDSLLIIDQHAAEERINYEKYMAYYKNKEIAQQQLISPLIIELTATETQYLQEYLETFHKLGFVIDEYGRQTFRITAVPIILGDVQLDKQFFLDLLDEFSSEESFILDSTLYEKVALRACKASIRAGETLTIEQMRELIEDIFACKNPYACAHGRPTMTEMSSYDLAKQFKRIL